MNARHLNLMGASALATHALLIAIAAVASADVIPDRSESASVVTFEQFSGQCAHPEKNQVQRAPREIRLVCSNREVNWLAAQPGIVPLAASRSVSTAVLSDKFRVAAVTREAPVVRRDGACHRFEEVIETYTAEVPFTCEELGQAIGQGKGDPSDLCLSILEDGKEKNSRAVQVERTGRVVDTCASVAH